MNYRDFGHVVDSCPMNLTEQKEASDRLMCGSDKYGTDQYLCVPNYKKTAIIEYCYNGTVGLHLKGSCLVANNYGTVNTVSCSNFTSGCTSDFFKSSDLYQYPACHQINTDSRCFYADPNCLDIYFEMATRSGVFNTTLNEPSATMNFTNKPDIVHITTGMAVGIAIATLVSIFAVILIGYWYLHSRKKKAKSQVMQDRDGEEEEDARDINSEESTFVQKVHYEEEIRLELAAEARLTVDASKNDDACKEQNTVDDGYRILKGHIGCGHMSIQRKIVSIFDELTKILESEVYDTNLWRCLEKASPDYMTCISKRKKDILKEDHGIVVAGETSAGKSTLINKILRIRIFKGRNHESTSTVCKIRNSEKLFIKAELDDGEFEIKETSDIDVETEQGQKNLRDTLKNLTDMTIAKGSRKYKSVEIGLPVSFLKGNTIMVDTPGIGGSGEISQKLMEYLPNAVSFIFVINVSSAGGMQHDRLPEILKSIINLHMDDEMPCFDPRSVIFITNKWDSIKGDPDDSSDEEEVDKTWKKVTNSIKRNWPSVREENIFKMNLRDVLNEEKSISEFEKFRKVLEKVIKENENIRITEHFRYISTVLDDVCTGVRTRQKLIDKTRKEQEILSMEHQTKIKELKKMCKMKSKDWRQHIESFIQQQADKSFEYMSSDAGKDRILNPNGWEPILKVIYIPTSLGDDVKERIDHYITEIAINPEVVEEFKDIKDEILDFYEEISIEIEKMESEWKGNRDEKNYPGQVKNKEGSVAPYIAGVIATSPIWFPLLAAGFAIAVASLPFAAPLMTFLSRDSRKKKIIDEAYEKFKLSFRHEVRNALEDNYSIPLNKLITKVTGVILQRRLKYMKETIKEISKNREKIIANRQSLQHIAEKIDCIKNMAEEIKGEIIRLPDSPRTTSSKT